MNKTETMNLIYKYIKILDMEDINVLIKNFNDIILKEVSYGFLIIDKTYLTPPIVKFK